MSPRWQRLAVVGICASAALFISTSVWQFLGLLGPVLGLFFGGWLLSCVLEPLVMCIGGRARISRSSAVLVAYLALGAALGGVWIGAGPSIAHQVTRSLTSLPVQADMAMERLVSLQAGANAWLAQHGAPLQVDVTSFLSADGLSRDLAAIDPGATVSAVSSPLGNFGMMLLLSVFFLLGGPQLEAQVVQSFGDRLGTDVRYVLRAIHDVFESFARAQMLQGALYALGVWASLAMAGVDSAPVVGVLSGVLLLIPVIGAALALLLPVLAAALLSPTASTAASIAVAVVLVLWQQLVLNVVGPRLMSQRLGLPPLLVFFGVLAGGQLAGFWGAVFGIPFLAAVLTCFNYFRPRWSQA